MDATENISISSEVYLNVPIGNENSGTGPVRLLYDKSLESSETLISFMFRKRTEGAAANAITRTRFAGF